jgi:hypothetical protein
MSLLTKPRHRLVVQRRKTDAKDSLGNPKLVADGDPVTVGANVHPLRADEILARGLQESIARGVVARTWPGDIHSLIYFDGYEWEQEPAELFDQSRSTTHVEVVIKRRGKSDGPGL